jgi:hypothetical protein
MHYPIAAPALLLLLTLTGCTGGGQHATTTPAPAPAPTTVVVIPPPAKTPSTPANPTINKVGQPYAYPNGLTVTVEDLRQFVISDNAVQGTAKGNAVAVTIAIRNGTSAVFDTSSVEVTASYGPDGQAAGEVYDSGIGAHFSGTIPPRRAKTVTMGFEIPRCCMDGILIEIALGSDYASTFFEGSAVQ